MTVKRLSLACAAIVLLQGTVFAVYYNDLLYLRQPVTVIAAGPRDVFIQHATHALGRSKLTARHLETVAEAAKSFQLNAIEVQALERRLKAVPDDEGIRLRLADALRRSGQYDRAEHMYLELLTGSPEESQ